MSAPLDLDRMELDALTAIAVYPHLSTGHDALVLIKELRSTKVQIAREPILDLESLDALAALWQASTPGEWFASVEPPGSSVSAWVEVGDGYVLMTVDAGKYQDAKFCAAAHNCLPVFVAELRAARAEIMRLKKELDLTNNNGQWMQDQRDKFKEENSRCKKLVDWWRAASNVMSEADGDGPYRDTLRQCANDLDAALAPPDQTGVTHADP